MSFKVGDTVRLIDGLDLNGIYGGLEFFYNMRFKGTKVIKDIIQLAGDCYYLEDVDSYVYAKDMLMLANPEVKVDEEISNHILEVKLNEIFKCDGKFYTIMKLVNASQKNNLGEYNIFTLQGEIK